MRATPTAQRLPRSGKVALAASAVIQAVLGIEFVLSGLSKVADSAFAAHFRAFVQASPGSHRGIVAPLVQLLVLPHAAVAAEVATTRSWAPGLSC